MTVNIRLGRKNIKLDENWIDRAVRFISPEAARRRLHARASMALMSGYGYSGASKSKRSLSQWTVQSGDPDSDILYDLPTLRSRSRDLLRNAPLASGAVSNVVSSVVGQGLKLQCRIDRAALGMEDAQAEAWESATEREWRGWSESADCDVARTLMFSDMQELVFRQVLENGESFIALPRFYRQPFPYQIHLQAIEADRVRNPAGVLDSNTFSAGIEKDAYGAPTKYHISRSHPGNILHGQQADSGWDVIPAFGAKTGLRNIIHLFRTLRPGQTRGVPYLAPVIDALKQLDRYTEAELMAAVISGMFTVFVETERGDGNFGTFSPDSETGGSVADEDYKLGNGAIVGLAPGEKVETTNPGRPNGAFDPFVKSILQQIAVGLELPYEVLIRHFSASYSASRAALLESWRFFRGRRMWLARNFCQIVYGNWLWEAVASGRISAPGFFTDFAIRNAYLGTLWIGDAPGQIDPQKEAGAAEKRLSLGLSTLDEETVAITGGDFERNYPRISKERRMMSAIGMGSFGASGKEAPPDKKEDEE